MNSFPQKFFFGDFSESFRRFQVKMSNLKQQNKGCVTWFHAEILGKLPKKRQEKSLLCSSHGGRGREWQEVINYKPGSLSEASSHPFTCRLEPSFTKSRKSAKQQQHRHITIPNMFDAGGEVISPRKLLNWPQILVNPVAGRLICLSMFDQLLIDQ